MLTMLTSVFTVVGIASGVDLSRLDMQMLDGASIRIGTVAGIRYCTAINKAQLDELVRVHGEQNVKIGTVITPTQYVKDAGGFTMQALDALAMERNFSNLAYVSVSATYGHSYDVQTVDGVAYYVFAGSLENIKEQNQTLLFSGIGYVKIGNEIVYATYNESNSRSVGYVAYRAYMDEDTGLNSNDKSLIDNFANAYLVSTLGAFAPDITSIRYFETYDERMNNTLFSNVTTLLGWKDHFVYNQSGAGYVYGKDVQARYEDGKLLLQTTNTARAGFSSELEFANGNKANAQMQNVDHSFLTIPGLNNEVLFDKQNDTYALQFDLKIKESVGNVGVGLSICEQDTNFARGKVITASLESWVFCSNVNNTTNYYRVPGSIAEYCDPIKDVVRVKFVINRDFSIQQMWLNGVNVGSIIANQGQMGEEFELGLHLYGEGTVELDNLLVYSYDPNVNNREVIPLYQDADLRMMSLNVYLNESEPELRKQHILNLVNKYTPDVFCLQECNKGSYTRIVDELADRYSVAFRTHEDSGVLIYTPILYRKDRIELIESGGGWLDARYTGTNTKSYSWAVLRIKDNPKVFAVTNLHGAIASNSYTGYESYTAEQLAVLQSEWNVDNVRQMLDICASIRQKYGSTPTLFAGDFNFNDTSLAYAKAIESGLVEAETHATISRCTGYRTTHTPGSAARLGKSIDHIFYTPATVTAYTHYIGSTTEDELSASDHLMIYADVAFVERWTNNY